MSDTEKTIFNMTEKELIDYCLTYEAAFLDYPFDEETAVIRHSSNKKMFALIGTSRNKVGINLKCEPLRAEILRDNYKSVETGWHMNKKHWITVYVGGDVSEEELHEMIDHSYDLIKPKTKRKR